MEIEIMEYEIVVKELLVDGHPLTRFVKEKHNAKLLYEDLKKHYPNYPILFMEISRRVIEAYQPPVKQIPIPPCPRGHIGISNGKPVVRRIVGTDASFACTICGDFFTVPTKQ